MNDFLLKIMSIDSTSGNEAKLADYILKNFKPLGAKSKTHKINKNQKNLFFSWGKPKIVFCTHLDTVPPYIPPSKKGGTIYGRGACDAKGQIAVMLEACNQLYKEKQTDFGLLLVAGEEKDSSGAKAANKLITGCEYVIVGEPTGSKLTIAAKGNLLIDINVTGKPAHSGYPEQGDSAAEKLILFLNRVAKIKFPVDKILGKTTYNIASLESANAFNVISDKATCKLFFRTTFKTHEKIKKLLDSHLRGNNGSKNIKLKYSVESKPINFFTVPGFKKAAVAFGSDAPKLNRLGKPLLYGPGSILKAHTDNEQIKTSELKKAVKDLKTIYYKLDSLPTLSELREASLQKHAGMTRKRKGKGSS